VVLGLATDKQGNVFIVDASNNRVRRVDAKNGVITTVVGNGVAGFSGDGGPATSASINLPVISGFFGSPIAFDGSGNLYITDIGNMVVRRVDATTGVINTVAGNGAQGFAGDGGPAVNAELSFPISLAVTASGIIFINDSGNFVIRRVDQSGNISTYAGQGGLGFCGDGGPAINACLFFPQGLAVDPPGDLFIADTGNNVVRRVDGASQIITTVAGDGFQGFAGDGGPAIKAALNQLADVGFDPHGNLLIVDYGNNRVRRVRASDQFITTQAGGGTGGDGGPAFQATLADPVGVTADPEGNLFIADASHNRIRKVNHVNGLVSTVAGNGVLGFSGDNSLTTSASIDMPQSPVAFDGAGNFYITDTNNRRIRECGWFG
jgi:trimeric autotransporter adhesin